MNMVTLFTPKKQLKVEKAREQSIQAGKMIPTRDDTDALRHGEHGLKSWDGRKSSLLSLGFSKTAKVLAIRGAEYVTDVGVGVVNPDQKKGIRARLRALIEKLLKKKSKKTKKLEKKAEKLKVIIGSKDLRMTNHFIDRYLQRILKEKAKKGKGRKPAPTEKLPKRAQESRRKRVAKDLLNRMSDREKSTLDLLIKNNKGQMAIPFETHNKLIIDNKHILTVKSKNMK